MKLQGKSIWKNYLYNFLYKIITLILPLITAPYLARVIGAEGVGIYAYQIAIANYFIMFAKLGILNYGVRNVAAIKSDQLLLSQLFEELHHQQIIMTAAACGMYFLYIISGAPKDAGIAVCMGIAVVAAAFDINWFYNGLEQFKKIVVRNLIIKLVTVAGVFLFVKGKEDLWKYALVYAVDIFLGNCSFWIGIKKYVRVQNVSWKRSFCHLKSCFVLFIPILATSIYQTMDKIMLGSMSTMNETGLYENAEKIIYSLIEFIPLLGTVMLPRMAQIFSGGEMDKGTKYINYSMQFMIMFSSGMAFGIAAIAEEFVPLFYGKGFTGAVSLVEILAVTIIIIAWTSVIRSQYIIPLKKDYIYIITVCSGAVVNLIVNLICIPSAGAMGAAVGTVCAELMVAVVQALFVFRELPLKIFFRESVFYPAAGTGMFFVVRLLARQLQYNYAAKVMIEITSGAVVYFAMCAIFVCFFQKKSVRIDKIL